MLIINNGKFINSNNIGGINTPNNGSLEANLQTFNVKVIITPYPPGNFILNNKINTKSLKRVFFPLRIAN